MSKVIWPSGHQVGVFKFIVWASHKCAVCKAYFHYWCAWSLLPMSAVYIQFHSVLSGIIQIHLKSWYMWIFLLRVTTQCGAFSQCQLWARQDPLWHQTLLVTSCGKHLQSVYCGKHSWKHPCGKHLQSVAIVGIMKNYTHDVNDWILKSEKLSWHHNFIMVNDHW